jgi:hypothetical protein
MDRMVRFITEVATSVGIAGTGMMMSSKTGMRIWTKTATLCTKITTGMTRKFAASLMRRQRLG